MSKAAASRENGRSIERHNLASAQEVVPQPRSDQVKRRGFLGILGGVGALAALPGRAAARSPSSASSADATEVAQLTPITRQNAGSLVSLLTQPLLWYQQFFQESVGAGDVSGALAGLQFLPEHLQSNLYIPQVTYRSDAIYRFIRVPEWDQQGFHGWGTRQRLLINDSSQQSMFANTVGFGWYVDVNGVLHIITEPAITGRKEEFVSVAYDPALNSFRINNNTYGPGVWTPVDPGQFA